MYRALGDLRLLRLALHLEETLERYEEYLRQLLPDVPYRAELAPLFAGGSAHERLRGEYDDLEAETKARESHISPQEVLQTIRDCEDLAHDFYLRNLDRISDSRLVKLFRDLAAEERAHANLVDEIIRRQVDQRPKPNQGTARPQRV